MDKGLSYEKLEVDEFKEWVEACDSNQQGLCQGSGFELLGQIDFFISIFWKFYNLEATGGIFQMGGAFFV